jgi:uncharacterized protein
MTNAKLTINILLLFLFTGATFQENKFDFRIRTITAGVTMRDISDTESITKAIQFLEKSRQAFTEKGYEVQTTRISTQNLHELTSGKPTRQTIEALKTIDEIAIKNNVIISIGELMAANQYDPGLGDWTVQLTKETSNISFSISISSEKYGIHNKSIKAAAEVCRALALNSKGGEANFRFAASANCPAGIPFFPAAFHKGKNSFAIGLEYPNVITRVFKESSWENAEFNLKAALEKEMRPIEMLANQIQKTSGWVYDGIDTSPAPGLDASIGEAIEALTKKPFGASTTLSACSIITKVIKTLDIKSCGYSGLMLPVIEDKVLAKRAVEGNYTVDELLLYSSVSGTGLDVVPIAGNTSIEELEGVYSDVAALSIKYFNKALSARLFPIPGKGNGEIVEFENPYLTSSIIMPLN